MTLKQIVDAMVRKAADADAWESDDRYDEGYADAMLDAVDLLKELLEDEE